MGRIGAGGERSGPALDISILDHVTAGAGAESIPEVIDGFAAATAAWVERIDHPALLRRRHALASGHQGRSPMAGGGGLRCAPR